MRRTTLALAVVLLAACGRGRPAAGDAAAPGVTADGPRAAVDPGRLRITAVEVSGMWEQAAGEPPTNDALAKVLEAELRASGAFAGAADSGGGRVRDAHLRVDYLLHVEPAGDRQPVRVQAAVEARLEWTPSAEDPAPRQNAITETPVPRGEERNLAAVARAHMDRSLVDVARGLAAQERVRGGAPEAVIAALTAEDDMVQNLAFAVVAERQMREAVPRLLELLAAENASVRDAAIGALVALRETSAVKPLTQLAKFHDLDTMRRVVDAIGAIGGAEAESWLEFVAGGHEDPIIRGLAKDALERMRRRAAR